MEVQSGLDVVELRRRDEIWITIAGELDVATVPQLERAIARLAADVTVVIDLSGLSFIDASGVHAICDVHARRDNHLRLIAGPPSVQRVFQLLDLEHMLPFVRHTQDGRVPRRERVTTRVHGSARRSLVPSAGAAGRPRRR